MNRAEFLKSIIERLHSGESVDDVKNEFKEVFKDVPASEIAEAERLLIAGGMPVEEIQNLCDVHASLFEGEVKNDFEGFEMGHPLEVFRAENIGIKSFIDVQLTGELQKLKYGKGDRIKLKDTINKLSKIDLHYSRKENLLFPYLEKAGITAPPKVMWGVDDEIREKLSYIKVNMDEMNDEELYKKIENATDQILAMIKKEDEILSPLLIHNLTESDWRVVARESAQIGYVFTGGIEGASPSDANAWLKDGIAEPELINSGDIRLPSGYFETEELVAILNSLPCDITFVGADDKVHFFSEQENRVFPRTRTIIGRRVADCHPPKSLDAVEKLIEAFKSGKKDSESFWIQRGGAFILIRYYAIRNSEGAYLGVLETTEEISELRSLEGNKTLMD